MNVIEETLEENKDFYNLLSSGKEVKYYDLNIQGFNVYAFSGTAPTNFMPMYQIRQGTGISQRVGDRIRVFRIELNFEVVWETTNDANDFVRIFMFYDKLSKNPVWTDYLITADPYSNYNFDNLVNRFVPIRQWTVYAERLLIPAVFDTVETVNETTTGNITHNNTNSGTITRNDNSTYNSTWGTRPGQIQLRLDVGVQGLFGQSGNGIVYTQTVPLVGGGGVISGTGTLNGYTNWNENMVTPFNDNAFLPHYSSIDVSTLTSNTTGTDNISTTITGSDTVGLSTTGTNTTTYNYAYGFWAPPTYFKRIIETDLEINYGGNTGTVTDIINGAIYLIAGGNFGAPNEPQIYIDIRIYYVDS